MNMIAVIILLRKITRKDSIEKHLLAQNIWWFQKKYVSLQQKYIMGMATFTNDKDRLARLCLYLKSVGEDIEGVEEKMDKVSDKLKHPFND